MACRLVGAKPLSESLLDYCQLDPYEHISMKFETKYNNFIDKNAFENAVWKMAAILSWPQCVNWSPAVVSSLRGKRESNEARREWGWLPGWAASDD